MGFIKVLGVAGFGGSSTRISGLFELAGSLLEDISWRSNPEMLLVRIVLEKLMSMKHRLLGFTYLPGLGPAWP